METISHDKLRCSNIIGEKTKLDKDILLKLDLFLSNHNLDKFEKEELIRLCELLYNEGLKTKTYNA